MYNIEATCMSLFFFFQNERTYHENHFISRILKLNIENDINIYICIKMSLVHKAYIYTMMERRI